MSTVTAMSTEEEKNTRVEYALTYAKDAPEETERLDIINNGLRDYIGGRLSLAPLENNPPATILELGSGSGAWAIEAAEKFPNADVIAVDLAPIPPRSIPPNLKFQAHDITQPFPFQPETFDIVHSRLVFTHLPKPDDTLNRVIQLVKPGGWLLLEDLEVALYAEGGLGPNQQEFWKAFHAYRKGQGLDPFVATTFEKSLNASNSFSEVHARKVDIPFSDSRVPGIESLGYAMKHTYHHAGRQICENPAIEALTTEIGDRALAELDDPRYKHYVALHLTWSRKKF